MRSRKRAPATRIRVGRVSIYLHHGAWWLYYRDGGNPVRRKIAKSREVAEQIAAQVNAQLTSGAPTLLAFTPVSVPELRQQFLSYHDNVLKSSVATIGAVALRHGLHIPDTQRRVRRTANHTFHRGGISQPLAGFTVTKPVGRQDGH